MELQNVINTMREDKWEYQNWDSIAKYACICLEHSYKLLCNDCKEWEYKEWDYVEYYSLKVVSSNALKVLSMIKHIEEDCDLRINNKYGKAIKQDLILYQNKIEQHEESVLSHAKDANQQKYRKKSAALFESIIMLGELLLDSKTFESYSKLYMRSHIWDLSNLYGKDISCRYATLQSLEYSISLLKSRLYDMNIMKEFKTYIE